MFKDIRQTLLRSRNSFAADLFGVVILAALTLGMLNLPAIV